MKVVALVSGGKDSCYAMMKCIQYGHDIVAFANLMPADDSIDELDSFMYQTVGHQIIESYAECMGLPLFRRRIQGSTKHQKLNYRTTPGDEVEDMFALLSEVKRQIPSVAAVSSGAIASDYQRLRVESVCSRLGLVSLAYLWKQDQSLLLQEMIANGIVAITVKVAAMGLDPEKHLGKELAFLKPHLHKLADLYGINVCGEGGEYETLTLDCPLFVNARIVLDDFQIVVPTPGSIASVGFLHPSKFHLESKGDDKGKSRFTKGDNVFEVQGDRLEPSVRPNAAEVTKSFEVTPSGLRLSKTQKLDTFSISCWTENRSRTSADLQEDLKTVLQHIESQLAGHGFGWGQVLYIHLYVNDMNEFAVANDTYMKFITQEKCPFGVPSRSTIELPLLQAGIGSAYVEVLVADDETKNVLHVQSISSWAPSCIGPYSQATLHKEILLMAGQLGLDPPRMTLGNNGPTAELEQALHNAEAVARAFNRSISTSSILITVYCSTRVPISERGILQDKQDSFLAQLRQAQSDEESKLEALHPLVVYVLVPDLPKRALVEVKPTLYVPDKTETRDVTIQKPSSEFVPTYWGFQHMSWHDSCIQKCVVRSKICAVLLSINHGTITKICSESEMVDCNDGDHEISLKEEHIKRVTRFCVHLLDKVITEDNFSWDDVLNLRLYTPASLNITVETLSLSFGKAFTELAEMGRNCQAGTNPVFNIVPVVGAGRSAALMDDIITCELLARK